MKYMFPKIENNFPRNETSLQSHLSLVPSLNLILLSTNYHTYLLTHHSVFLHVLFSRKKCTIFFWLPSPFPTPFVAWLTPTSSLRYSSNIMPFNSLSLVLRSVLHYGPLTFWTYLITYLSHSIKIESLVLVSQVGWNFQTVGFTIFIYVSTVHSTQYMLNQYCNK